MALPPNAQAVPAPTAPVDPAAAAEADRQKKIAVKRKAEQDKVNIANNAARAKAVKKRGTKLYDYKKITGNPDYGIGESGPGTPYSVKTSKAVVNPKKLPKWIQPALPKAGTPLWPIGNTDPMKDPGWKAQAIRRRLNNG